MKLLRAVGVGLYTALLYLGLPLLGWDGLQTYFSSGPRLGYAAVVALFSLAVSIQAYGSLEGIVDSPGQKDKWVRRQTVIGAGLTLLLFAAMFFIPLTSRLQIAIFPENRLLSLPGLALSALGYLLIFWSGVALGRMYSAEVTIQKDHRLVTGGPYRLVRHPRYLGILCVALGMALIFHTWIGLGVTLASMGLLLWRIRDEEALLSREFGEAWVNYCHCSWRLVPYLY